MKKYRLAYFVSHPIQYQAPLLRKLAKHPHIDLEVFFLSDFSIQSYIDPGFGQKVSWDVTLTDGYTHSFLPKIRESGRLSFANPIVYGVEHALKKKRWDAVWFHGYAHYAMIYGILRAFQLKIPVLFRAESNLTCTSKGPLKNLLIKSLVRRAAGLLWISSDNRDYYKYYGAKNEQLFFTPYAVDNTFFQNKAAIDEDQKKAFRFKIGLTQDLPVILYASKMIPRKNALLLFEAFRKIAQAQGSAPAYLVYIGDGEQRPAIEKRIKKTNLGHCIKLLGFKNQSELPAYFSLSDIFVLPSEKEPFGLIINEVMNAGKAIITTREVGAARDLVRDEKNGFVTEAGNLMSLRRALEKALMDQDRLQAMGQQSLRHIQAWSYQEDLTGILECLDHIGAKLQ